MSFLLALCVSSALLFSCKAPKVSHYKIPKEMRIKSTEELSQLRDLDIFWSLPVNWVSGELGQFRVASFRFSNESTADDVTVTRFPGQSGGFLRNINRWRGQVGLDPTASTDDLVMVPVLGDIPAQGYRIEINGDKQSILALIVSVNNWTYFIKYQDGNQRFNRYKETVLSFMSTVNTMDDPNGVK
jgi:hypothetical protein